MTNYNDGNWHGWNGGECPVHPETVVEVQFNDDRCKDLSGNLDWKHRAKGGGGDFVAFRVIKEYKEPREVYISTHGKWYDSIEEFRKDYGHTDTPVLFREVAE